MEQWLDKLANLGALGIIAAAALFELFYLSRRMLTVIENNTRAMTELKETIGNMERRSYVR